MAEKTEQMRGGAKRRITKIAWALAFIFTAGTVLASLFLIKADVYGASMEPGFSDGDTCIAVKFIKTPSRGDVVLAWDAANGRVLIKRVAALPGDHIEISSDGHAALNGAVLDEPYAAYGAGSAGSGCWTVPEGCVFLLGDNRGSSQDSRSSRVGMVPISDVMGRVVFKLPGWAGKGAWRDD